MDDSLGALVKNSEVKIEPVYTNDDYIALEPFPTKEVELSGNLGFKLPSQVGGLVRLKVLLSSRKFGLPKYVWLSKGDVTAPWANPFEINGARFILVPTSSIKLMAWSDVVNPL